MKRSRVHRSGTGGRSRRRRRSSALVKRWQGSKIGNGTQLLPGTDHRGPEMRHYKSLLASFKSDIPEPSTAEQLLINDAAYLELLIARQKADFVRRKMKPRNVTELIAFLQTIGARMRVLTRLGLRRRAKEVEDLDEYLARAYPQQDDVIDAQPVNEPEPAEVVE